MTSPPGPANSDEPQPRPEGPVWEAPETAAAPPSSDQPEWPPRPSGASPAQPSPYQAGQQPQPGGWPPQGQPPPPPPGQGYPPPQQPAQGYPPPQQPAQAYPAAQQPGQGYPPPPQQPAQAAPGYAPYAPPGSAGPAFPQGGAPGQYAPYRDDLTTPGGWPPPTSSSPGRGATLALVALLLAALASLVYAAWALTARRGIFSDFSAGRFVGASDAKSSDAIDTTLLIVAGVIAVAALVLWVVRRTTHRTRGGALDIGGLGLSLLGVITVVVGLFLASKITDAVGQAAEGDKGVTATVVIGVGFVVLALGLIIGTLAVRGGRDASPASNEPYQAW